MCFAPGDSLTSNSGLSESLIQLIAGKSETEDVSKKDDDTDKMSMEDKMLMWQERLDNDSISEVPIDALIEVIEDDFQPEMSEDVPVFDKYAEMVFGDHSYEWLTAGLRSKKLLTDEAENIKESVREEVLQALPKTRKLQSRCIPAFEVVFEVLWPLRSFLSQQFPDMTKPDIHRVITITGSIRDAQALTCEQYMIQTWPCTGVHLLGLLQRLLQSDMITRHYCKRPDGTIMEAWQANESVINVKVMGTHFIIAEVAEQLSWLNAALRTSTKFSCDKTLSFGKLVICTPSAKLVTTNPHQHPGSTPWDGGAATKQTELCHESQESSSTRKSAPSSDAQNPLYCFRISTETQEVDYAREEGTCWDQMIHSMIMIHGFPIRRRATKSLGLEISLRVAADLIGTKYITTFAGQTFVKGYSAMLKPVQKNHDIVVWHLLVNPTGDHISYCDDDLISSLNIDILGIGSFRHVIGWCGLASNYAGAADAHLAVRRANLPNATSKSVLFGDNISFGKTLISNTAYNIPKQYQTTHAERQGLWKMLKYLCQHSILLWDKADQRGWLVNGTAALLHMVRTSLYFEQEDSIPSLFVLKPTDLKEPTQPHSAKAALQFFGELDNLEARVSIKDFSTIDQSSTLR